MNFLLRNTFKNASLKTIETSAIQSQRKYEYFLNKLNSMNQDFEKKMNEKEYIELNINFKQNLHLKKIKDWEGL